MRHSEDVIRKHWPIAAKIWPEGYERVSVAVGPESGAATSPFLPDAHGAPCNPHDVLTYERERGTMNGVPWVRIVCEGVVLEDWPADTRNALRAESETP
jgi:hypothetical protein